MEWKFALNGVDPFVTVLEPPFMGIITGRLVSLETHPHLVPHLIAVVCVPFFVSRFFSFVPFLYVDGWTTSATRVGDRR